MGCGFSKQAASDATQESLRSRGSKLAGDAAESALEGIETGMECAENAEEAAEAALAIAGGIVAVAGEALLELGKSLPWVAPVAILIGACCMAARNVYVLQEDCTKFARLVTQLEKIMLQAKLDNAKGVCEDLKGVLEEGLAQCRRCSKRYSMILAKKYSEKFKDITEEVQKLAQLLTLSASVDVHSMLSTQYQQSKMLKDKIQEMGGASALVNDDTGDGKLELILKECSGSEQLMIAHAEKSQELMDAHAAVAAEQMGAMQKQMERLMGYLGNVFETEIAEPSGDSVRDYMVKRPVAVHDDAQNTVRLDLGLKNGNWAWHGNKLLGRLCSAAIQTFNAPIAWVAAIDNDIWIPVVCQVRQNDGVVLADKVIGKRFERSLAC